MPDMKSVILTGLSVVVGLIGLVTATLGLLHALTDRWIKQTDQSLPDSSFEFLNIKREPSVPRVSDKSLRHKAYRTLFVRGALFWFLGLYFFVLAFMFLSIARSSLFPKINIILSFVFAQAY